MKRSVRSMKEDYSRNDANDEMPEITDFSDAIYYRDFKEAKKQTTIRLKPSTIYYFQQMASKTGISYQTLINMYLDDCAKNKRTINITWMAESDESSDG